MACSKHFNADPGRTPEFGLNIFSSNIRSLRIKVANMASELHQSRPDVIAIQETWLNGSITDNDLSINDYSIIRRERNINGGGVAFYVNHRLGWSIPDLRSLLK